MQKRRLIIMFVVALVSVAILFFNATDVMALKVGDKAPDFTLPSTTGEKISLSQFQEKKPVVRLRSCWSAFRMIKNFNMWIR